VKSTPFAIGHRLASDIEREAPGLNEAQRLGNGDGSGRFGHTFPSSRGPSFISKLFVAFGIRLDASTVIDLDKSRFIEAK